MAYIIANPMRAGARFIDRDQQINVITEVTNRTISYRPEAGGPVCTIARSNWFNVLRPSCGHQKNGWLGHG